MPPVFGVVIFLWLADFVEGIDRFRETWLGQPEMTSIAESAKRGSQFLKTGQKPVNSTETG